MCDYNQESRKALATVPLPLSNLTHHLMRPGHRTLMRTLASGRARRGCDLYDGAALPAGSLERGHFMSPMNFDRLLARMARQPHRCHWCGRILPASLIRQHQRPHNHREDQQHHFHPSCWKARLLAIAVVFGHVRPEQLLGRRRGWTPRVRLRETIIVTLKKVLRVKVAAPRRRRRRWLS